MIAPAYTDPNRRPCRRRSTLSVARGRDLAAVRHLSAALSAVSTSLAARRRRRAMDDHQVLVLRDDERLLRQDRTLDEILRDPAFRAWQQAWRRRIAFSRRLAPLDDGTVDPVAPAGRWAC